MEERLSHRKQSPSNHQKHHQHHSWEIWNGGRCDGNRHGYENGYGENRNDENDGGCENDDAESETYRARRKSATV